VEEKLFIEEGRLVRPFCKSAKVRSLGYSLALQRAVSDFGADGSFCSATFKMKEHYGIEVPHSTIRLIVEKHGRMMGTFEIKRKEAKEETIISETDGGMVPILSLMQIFV
jgi:hypothetical protein